jgi:hypothetical protein
MGTDLPIATPPLGATHRWRSDFVIILGRLLFEGSVHATCEPVGSLPGARNECQPSSDEEGRCATDDVDGLASDRRTIGRTGVVAFHWRRSTTVKPARSNMDSVPW